MIEVSKTTSKRKCKILKNVPHEFHTMCILGTRVHLVQNSDVLKIMESWINDKEKKCHFIVNTGFHGLHVANENFEFRNIVNSADLFSPDGITMVWLARLLGKNLPNRATSAELMHLFFEKANDKKYKSFFFGDTDDTLEALQMELQNKYPGHRVVGTYSPPFRQSSKEENQKMIDLINQAEPDVLWVGLGLPKQERWIHENRDRLNVPVAIGVGACFGFYSGKVKRAPGLIGNAGFEWLWRLLVEPKKLWRRYLISGPIFIFHIVINWQKIKKANDQ